MLPQEFASTSRTVPTPPDSFDAAWFARAERESTPPPYSTRTPNSQSTPPDPIGDAVADTWFR